MNKKDLLKKLILILLILFFSKGFSQSIYPPAKLSNQVDTIWGQQVKDPYRWMEDIRSPEVTEWLKGQGKIADKFSGKTASLYGYLKEFSIIEWEPLFKQGPYYFSYSVDVYDVKWSGESYSLYYQKSDEGIKRLLFDPNNYDKHAIVSVDGFCISPDNSILALELSKNGSDWKTIRFLDMKTKNLLDDTLDFVKYSEAYWFKNGLFYMKYDVKNINESFKGVIKGKGLYYHKIGTKQSQDILVYKNEEAEKDNDIGFSVTPRKKYLIIYREFINSGKRYYAMSMTNLNDSLVFRPRDFIITTKDSLYFDVLGEWGDKLLVQSNLRAPNGAIYKYSPGGINQAEAFIPEYSQRLEDSKIIGGGNKILTTYFKDNLSVGVIRDSTGKPLTKWAIPDGSRFSYFSGSIDDSVLIFAFHSFISPSCAYKINVNTYKTNPLSKTHINFSIADLVTETVYYHSKDGTTIPMYLTHRSDMKLNGNNPTILTGYGGFGIPTKSSFSAINNVFLRSGGVLAAPCIRGGGDFPGWHEKGKRLNKQNSYDDFIAAAEYLISKQYTNPQKLAIMGGSNGGLLVGAVMLQRPELFKVVVSQSGVFDMMRYDKYNIGYEWKNEYGAIDDSSDFKNLVKYSPVQNVKQGVSYPATLLVASDNDDRVSPFHSFKFLAELQAKGNGENPYVLYYVKKAGHSGNDNFETRVNTETYIYAFIFKYLGMQSDILLGTERN